MNSVRGAKYNAFDSAFEDYYPFGKGWENPAYSSNFDKYTYNGKEMQTTGWLPYLDYGARMYDPRIGRWFGPDPLAEKYYSTSPYAFCANNPINRIDLDGMDNWYTNDPIEIQKFLTHMATRPLSEYDLSAWRHTTDEELAGAEVVYNDATNTAYYKWSSMEDGVPTANALIFPGIRESSANMGDIISSWVGPIASFGGIMAGIGAEVAFSEAFNTWMGRDMKIRSQNWGGNQYTGGKVAFAKKLSTYFKWAGGVASIASQIALYYSYDQGEISRNRYYIETASNGIGLIPIYGTAWSIGWEAGRYTGKWLNDN